MKSSALILFGLSLSPLFLMAQDLAPQKKEIDFNRDIRPILSDRCIFCHGPDEEHREADLRLDQEDSAKELAIVPGDINKSELVARILSDDEDEQMPPPDSGKKLSADEIQLLKDWIVQGAQWAEHWSFVEPKKNPIPIVRNKSWPRNWIDHFVLARLEQENLAPSAPADRVTLLRRVCFDLTGLPPGSELAKAFLNDQSPQAYEKLIDRLLASPQFGERMAMYWLDLVRYADTVGYHGDQDHNISPYRDYVINAFNDNMPFDQFTREQLAGDLLENPTQNQKIATGYNRLLQTSHEGGVQKKEYLAIYAADRVRNVSNVWMGATMGCCQCHDHKYDPFTIKDFYSMVSFFADVDEQQHFKVGSNSLPTKRPPEIDVLAQRQLNEIAQLEHQLSSLTKKFGQRGKEYFAQVELERKAKQAQAKRKAAKKTEPKQGSDAPPRASLITIKLSQAEKETLSQIKKTQAKIAAIQAAKRRAMVTQAVTPREIRVLARGDWMDDSGKIVEPEIPEFLGSIKREQHRSSRLDLANWFVDQEGYGGMTARVYANRFWYLLFNVGFSSVLEDLGGQGEPPTHPELLDNLAIEFQSNGWNIKQTLKLILMSRTYQQSSVPSDELLRRDPGNRLFARQTQFRLPAETIRDNALAISGLLVQQIGGDSVKPYQPVGYYRHLNFPQRKYQQHDDQRQWRRGLYMHWQRQFLHPMLKAFDAPSREECTARRPKSNTPIAAITLLNDPTFVEAARVFAEHVIRSGGKEIPQRIAYAYHRSLNRAPTDLEQDVFSKLVATELERYGQDEKSAKQLVAIGNAPQAREIDPTELAAWTAVARAMLNLSETNSRQ